MSAAAAKLLDLNPYSHPAIHTPLTHIDFPYPLLSRTPYHGSLPSSGGSDPFARFTLLNLDNGGFESGRTQPLYNSTDPAWPHAVQLILPTGQGHRILQEGGPLVSVTIWDKDMTSANDMLGTAQLRLTGTSGAHDALALTDSGGGSTSCTISFKYSLSSRVAPAATLTLRRIRAFDVPDKDVRPGSKGSDPYLSFKLLECGDLEMVARTPAKPNQKNPEWSEALTLELPRGSPRPSLLCVRVWDDDLHDADDPIATTDVRLVPTSEEAGSARGVCEVKLQGIGRKNRGVKISFDWDRIDDAE